MNAFEFSDRTLEDLERIQGGATGRGKIDRKGQRDFSRVVNHALSVPAFAAAGSSKAGVSGSRAQRTTRAMEGLNRTVKRAPQVVVKITSRIHGAPSTLGAMTYVSRLGMKDKEPLALETSEGEILTRADEMMKLAREWQTHELSDEARRKGATAIAMVFSMPPGTDAQKVRDAVRDLAETDMGNRRWAMALHTDEPHPHVHLIIAARDDDGRRFNPDREFLRQCRERFAENLRARGVEADATMRIARGYPPKQDKMPVLKMRERGAEPKSDAVKKAALNARTPADKDAMAERINQRTKTAENTEIVKGVYRRVIDELEAYGGADEVARAKALRIYVQSMPEPLDAKAEIIERLKSGNALAPDYEKDRELEKLKARVAARDGASTKAAHDKMLAAGEALQAKFASLQQRNTTAKQEVQRTDRAVQIERIRTLTERLAQPKKQAVNVSPRPEQTESERRIQANYERLQEIIRDHEKDRERDRVRAKDRERDGPTR